MMLTKFFTSIKIIFYFKQSQSQTKALNFQVFKPIHSSMIKDTERDNSLHFNSG